MNVEIGTETPIFFFWEYLFQIFGILSLQCVRYGEICRYHIHSSLGNAVIIRDQRYRTDPDAGMPMPGLKKLTAGKNADARLTFHRHEQKRRCRNQSGTGIRGPSPIPECSGIGLGYRMLACRRRHRPLCGCPAMHTVRSAWTTSPAHHV